VRSIIHALQSESIRRVRVGVGRPKGAAGAVGHVLTTFTDDERVVINRAGRSAADEVRALVAATGKPKATRTPIDDWEDALGGIPAA
jgi:peptidyl-tRNA hydrolase